MTFTPGLQCLISGILAMTTRTFPKTSMVSWHPEIFPSNLGGKTGASVYRDDQGEWPGARALLQNGRGHLRGSRCRQLARFDREEGELTQSSWLLRHDSRHPPFHLDQTLAPVSCFSLSVTKHLLESDLWIKKVQSTVVRKTRWWEREALAHI